MSNFYEAMISYLQRFPNDVVVIESKPENSNEREFQAQVRDSWFAYLERKGYKHTLETWRLILRGYGKALTLPCANPADFDREYAREFSPRNRHWDQ
jgi:hypothetical protein